MTPMNRAQRVALKRIFDRGLIFVELPNGRGSYRLTYREFRKSVQGYVGGDCVMVRWGRMWLGIEKDGHVHS